MNRLSNLDFREVFPFLSDCNNHVNAALRPGCFDSRIIFHSKMRLTRERSSVNPNGNESAVISIYLSV
jgi:hypothetical protein